MTVAKPLRLVPRSKPCRSKQAWREIGKSKFYFRSEWEYKFAQYLELQKNNHIIKGWEHEPQTFWFEDIKRGVRSYLPDFKVTRPDGSHYWIEVKGFMDRRSATKIKRFKKYYPKEMLLVVDDKWFKLYGQKIPV